MKVVAIREGYYNHKRVYEGQEIALFDVKHFSEKWMKKLSGSSAPISEVYREPVVQDEFNSSDDVI